MKLAIISFLSVVFLLPCNRTLAQSISTSISGNVRDQFATAVSGAQVQIGNVNNGIDRTAITDENGRYVFAGLNPGNYRLRVEKSGFKAALITDVVLSVSEDLVVDVTLSVGEISEQVTVDLSSLISLDKSGVSRVIGLREIESLPIGGRNFVDFVKLSTNISMGRENVGGGSFKEPDAGIGAAAVPRLSFGGQSELNTLIQVDGLDNIQTLTGLPRATPSMEAVREFRIINNSYLAEYGRALGGFVNIVTSSGGEQNHGTFYYFGGNQVLNARSILNPTNPTLSQNQYGATIGGPLIKNRSFFLGNYEGQRRVESNKFSQVILSNLAAINATRTAFGLQPEVNDLLRSNNYDQFLLKLNHHFNENDTLAARYSMQKSVVRGFLGGGGRASPASTTARNSDSLDQTLAVNYTAIYNSRWVNEFRSQWASRSYDFESVLKEPALEIPNLLIMGKSSSDMDFYHETRIQFADDLSVISDKHQYKVGFGYNNLYDKTIWGLFFPARIIFPNLNAFLAFRPNSTSGPVNFWWPQLTAAISHPGFSVPFVDAVPRDWLPATTFNMTYSSFGFYAQDQWKLNEHLTLSYGMRYDFEAYPSRYIKKQDLDNIQPRIGIAYAKSWGIARIGFGVFHDRIASSVGQIFAIPEWTSRGEQPNATTLFGNVAPIPGRFQQINALGSAATPAAIDFLTTGRLPTSGVSSLAGSLDSRLSTPFSEQASLQFSKQVKGVLVSLNYLFVHGQKLIGQSANLNAFRTGTLFTGKPLLAGRYFNNLGNFVVISNLGESTYHGGTLEVERRFGRGFAFHSSYTFSKTLSTLDSAISVADIPEGLELERSLSRQHVANRFTLSLFGQFPQSFGIVRNFKIGLLTTLESGRPYTVFVGSDVNADGNPNSDRPGQIGKNTLMGPRFFSVDLRVARRFSFKKGLSTELSLDFFNLLNSVNVKDLNTVYGSMDLGQPPNSSLGFGTPRDAYNPRQIQYGIKFLF